MSSALGSAVTTARVVRRGEGAHRAPPPRSLRGEDVDLADVGRRGQQLVGAPQQGRRDPALEVRLAAGLIGERVEDAEAARPGAERVPDHGAGLLRGERLGAAQQVRAATSKQKSISQAVLERAAALEWEEMGKL
ncbi:MAG TPA: hypothetical protein VF516_38680 [Kofleriaceae bacterium]